MTDIVEDLRGRARGYRIGGPSAAHTAVMLETAADEIERLRAALRDIRDMGPMTVDDQRWRIAKNALEGKHD